MGGVRLRKVSVRGGSTVQKFTITVVEDFEPKRMFFLGLFRFGIGYRVGMTSSFVSPDEGYFCHNKIIEQNSIILN